MQLEPSGQQGRSSRTVLRVAAEESTQLERLCTTSAPHDGPVTLTFAWRRGEHPSPLLITAQQECRSPRSVSHEGRTPCREYHLSTSRRSVALMQRREIGRAETTRAPDGRRVRLNARRPR